MVFLGFFGGFPKVFGGFPKVFGGFPRFFWFSLPVVLLICLRACHKSICGPERLRFSSRSSSKPLEKMLELTSEVKTQTWKATFYTQLKPKPPKIRLLTATWLVSTPKSHKVSL